MSAPTSHSPAQRTWHLGVTGGIGSGKSTLAAMLAQQGAVLIDADQISRSLTAAGGAAIAAIRAQFGAALIDADGALDRAQMRALVFSQPSARPSTISSRYGSCDTSQSRPSPSHNSQKRGCSRLARNCGRSMNDSG